MTRKLVSLPTHFRSSVNRPTSTTRSIGFEFSQMSPTIPGFGTTAETEVLPEGIPMEPEAGAQPSLDSSGCQPGGMLTKASTTGSGQRDETLEDPPPAYSRTDRYPVTPGEAIEKKLSAPVVSLHRIVMYNGVRTIGKDGEWKTYKGGLEIHNGVLTLKGKLTFENEPLQMFNGVLNFCDEVTFRAPFILNDGILKVRSTNDLDTLIPRGGMVLYQDLMGSIAVLPHMDKA